VSATAALLHPSAERERAFVVRGQQLFREQFPTAVFRFVDPVWDVRSLDRARHHRSNARAHFTRLGSVDVALPARYADVLKAACVKDLHSKAHLLMRVGAGRVLWEAIVARVGDSDRFAWSVLSEADFLEAEQRMLHRWSSSTTYVACNALQRLIEVLSGRPCSSSSACAARPTARKKARTVAPSIAQDSRGARAAPMTT